MKRLIYNELLKWKNQRNRKPLVLEGARQTGKTWILKEFGKNCFEKFIYINCDNNSYAENLFRDYDTRRILRDISAYANQNVTPGDTLIFLDEIQEVPRGIAALKYFCEEAPEYPVVAAGSLLGIAIHQGTGFPVGKVDEMELFPMNFVEFIMAMGYDVMLRNIREMAEAEKWEDIISYKEKMQDLLRQYYYVGGMPEAVREYSEDQNLQAVRLIQNNILKDYQRDFSKHAPSDEVPRINMVWNSIPSQLSRENKKFIYGALKKGARAKEFEKAIQWLMDAGLVYKVNRLRKIEKPLKFYEDFDAFKLFVSDLGLLGAMAETDAKDVLLGNRVFSEYKGAFAEQYVLQQLVSEGVRPYYFTNEKSTLELDFVIQMDHIYPIEVKAEENLKSKSLRSVVAKKPDLTGWRFSMSDYRDQGWMKNIPLYLVNTWLIANKNR